MITTNSLIAAIEPQRSRRSYPGVVLVLRSLTIASRRAFLASAGAGAMLVGCAHASHTDPRSGADREGDQVTPAEDLMREHGVLRRVMYVYDDAIRRLDEHRDRPPDALA